MSISRTVRTVFCVLALALLPGMALQGASHTIKRGDTLYSLARTYKTTVSALMSHNGIKDPRTLKVGQRLKIPSGSSTSKPGSARSTIGKGKAVIIDAGHGGKDWGAFKGGIRESDLNLRVAKMLEAELKRHGYTVIMTRRSDRFLHLHERARIANRYPNAIFVSIHFNSTRYAQVRGAETFYASSAGRSLATLVQREIVPTCKVRNRGVRYARFTVLTQTKCPAVLVECGFISNASERARCATKDYQQRAARAIAAGIRAYKWR